jgi:hypothetical protein
MSINSAPNPLISHLKMNSVKQKVEFFHQLYLNLNSRPDQTNVSSGAGSREKRMRINSERLSTNDIPLKKDFIPTCNRTTNYSLWMLLILFVLIVTLGLIMIGTTLYLQSRDTTVICQDLGILKQMMHKLGMFKCRERFWMEKSLQIVYPTIKRWFRYLDGWRVSRRMPDRSDWLMFTRSNIPYLQ